MTLTTYVTYAGAVPSFSTTNNACFPISLGNPLHRLMGEAQVVSSQALGTPCTGLWVKPGSICPGCGYSMHRFVGEVRVLSCTGLCVKPEYSLHRPMGKAGTLCTSLLFFFFSHAHG